MKKSLKIKGIVLRDNAKAWENSPSHEVIQIETILMKKEVMQS